MIVFDLQCAAGHQFEGWFDGLSDLEAQLAQGLVVCPVCSSEQVRRVPSAFAIARHRQGSASPGDGTPQPDEAARMLGQAVKRYLKENFEDVGSNFAREALKIHYGVEEPRNIRGVSTPDEEAVLDKEGVEFFKLNPKPHPQGDSTEEED